VFNKSTLLFILFFFNAAAMEFNLSSSEIKKIIKRWKGREQFIDRLFRIAQDSKDSIPFRTIDEELIAIVDSKEQTVTTYCKDKTEITIGYVAFTSIMDRKEELKETCNQRYLGQNKGLCSLQ
jgi:hypothetical protein